MSQDGLIEKEESAELYVSGASDPLNVMIDEKNALAQMPVNSDSVETQEILPGATIVDMEGISFLVLEKESEFHKTLNDKNGVEQKKAYVRKLLNIYGLDDKPASGVLALTRDDTRISMEPYVYVRDTGTLYYETACGSGTTAVGMLEAANAGKSIQNLEIYQPSGKPISVTIEYDGKNYKSAAINGPVDIVFDGNMPLNNKADITPINDNILRNEI